MAEALISVLLEQLSSVVYEHTKEAVTLVLNAKKDVKSFRSKLKAIQAVLHDAEKKQVTEASVGDWLEKLKDVSYEMDDVIDEWDTEILRKQVEAKQEGKGENASVAKKKVCFPIPSDCFCFGQVNEVNHRNHIARRIKELNDKLTLIYAERKMYGFHQSPSRGPDEQLIQRQKTTSLVDMSLIFGREEEKEILLKLLLRGSSQEGGRFLVIPIVGMGGMGKTTLTQLAYNLEEVTAHFNKKVWVCVSDPFDEIKIAKAIIESLDKNESQRSSNELETLLLCIQTHIENKKLLLVLDDVWTEDKTKWKNLNLPVIMKGCAAGSTILVTTRKEGVAKMMEATRSMIHLDKMNDKDCLALFNSIAFSGREEDVSNGFGDIGAQIVERCKGLPLIVKTLSSLVHDKKTRVEWENVLNSKIWELEEVEEQVFRPLLLSYYDLAPRIKCCLLYCAIFPKDHEFNIDNLIEMWMSQNYLNHKQDPKKKEIGQRYFQSLVMRSFFQDLRQDDLGNLYGFKMHDIVHDFVQFLTEKECMITEVVQGANQRMEPPDDMVRHLTLVKVTEGPFSFPTSFCSCRNMRTLTILDSRITTISLGSIRQLKYLRTLNLSRNYIDELPKEIGELIHLRYLDLSDNVGLEELPDAVCDLLNLQTLILRFCLHFTKLPKAMGKLINLKNLYVFGCWKMKYLPKGIGSLESLQALDWFPVCDDGDDVEDEEALKLGDVGIMDQLQGSLCIERLGNAKDASEVEKAQLENKKHLSGLALQFQDGEDEQRRSDEEILKALRPHQNLERLSILYCHCTTWPLYLIKSLHNLRLVYLNEWNFCEVLPPLGKLPSLEILTIQWMNNVKKVGVEFLGIEEEIEAFSAGILFPKLKHLEFFGMGNWEEWEGIIKDSSEITIMPRLSSLRISRCPDLKGLPDLVHEMTTLRTLEIVACAILEGDYEKGVGKDWPKISHIPNITIKSSEAGIKVVT